MFSLTIVPLYDTLGLDSCVFIINQGEKLIYYHKLVNYNSVNDTYFNDWFCNGEDRSILLDIIQCNCMQDGSAV